MILEFPPVVYVAVPLDAGGKPAHYVRLPYWLARDMDGMACGFDLGIEGYDWEE